MRAVTGTRTTGSRSNGRARQAIILIVTALLCGFFLGYMVGYRESPVVT